LIIIEREKEIIFTNFDEQKVFDNFSKN